MADIKHLRLVLPDALTQLRELQQHDALAQVPDALRQLLEQGTLNRLWREDDLNHARLDPWQHSLLTALPADGRTCGLASAALCWRGEGGTLNGGTWLSAEPIHLTAGLSDVRLAFPPPPDQDESQQLVASLHPVLSLAGFELRISTPGRWYLWHAQPLHVVTYSPRSGFATRLYDIMPQGDEGSKLRRVMTEVQMLLHQHPVNLQREQRGMVTVNGLWLWGGGTLEAAPTISAPRMLGDHPYLHGLSEHLRVSCWPLPPNADALLSLREADVLVVLPSVTLSQLDQEWLQPILAALLTGQITQLELHLDQWQIRLQGGRWQQLRRILLPATHQLTEILA